MQSRGRTSVTMQVSSTRGQSRLFWGIWHLWNEISKSGFSILFFCLTLICTLWVCYSDLTSPWMRLARPSAAADNPGGNPKPADDSRLCISVKPGPLCPLAWRWRTLMASSRWSSILSACGQQTEPTTVEFSIYLQGLFESMICHIYHIRENNTSRLTMDWIPSTKLGEGVAWPEDRVHWEPEPRKYPEGTFFGNVKSLSA